MSTQHTPGPWADGLHYQGQLAIQADNGRLVALCGKLSQDDTQLENQANARLIAAAPELASLVSEIITAMQAGDLHEYGMSGDWYMEARAALTKAGAL